MTKIALVTGGTRGIGASISIALKQAGYAVAANYARNDEAAEKFKSDTGIEVFKFDVANFEECANGVKQIEEKLGAVDILVNNAGITWDGMLHKMPPEQWAKVIDVNLNSCFNVTRAVIEGMRERSFGRVINISSINAQAGQLGQVNYTATKAGIIGFTKSLALESARKNITVNAIAPGYIETDMTGQMNERVKDSIVSQIPVGRMGYPEEIARCVLFLADDNAGFITGETISVNGGHHIE